MELFAVHVADVSLLRSAGGRRVGGVQLAVRHKALGAHGEVLAVAANGDGALQVGAVDVHLCVPQDAQGLLVGVAVLVACAAGDDAHFRQNSVQKQVSGTGAGAVVPYLQHIGFQVGTAVHKVGLGGIFHVTGQQKAGAAVVDAQHQRGVVGLAVLRYRAQQGNGGAAQRPDGAHGGHFQLQALLLRILDKIVEAFGAALGHRAVSVSRRELCHYGGKPAHMVLVGVRAEHILQLLHPLLLQVGDHQTAVVHIAAVVEHELSVTLHQYAQRLPYVNEVHLKGLTCPGGGLDDVSAAAGQAVTGGKPQRQHSGQRQRSQPQEQAAGEQGYFFFFPVFHVAFSFC